ncbi:MAG: PA14 domain-containing protein [Chloroflexota bacterium]|nr:PA14 domain-containing protein [Chloroflexota bacterium]
MKNRNLWMAIPLALTLLLMTLPIAADDPSWHGEYYDNQGLSGAPALIRDDSAVNFNWGGGSPSASIPTDHFSTRWTRSQYFSGGDYLFHVTADDGVRLWVGGRLLIDQWHDQAATTYRAFISLSPGTHYLRLEHYENMGDAVIHCWWESGISFPDWRAEYFNNTTLSGTPVLRRNDPQINFDWGVDSPGPGVDSDNWSVRWIRTQHFDAGTYRFTATVDDGIRVWVDGTPVIDEWWEHPARSFSGDITLAAGDHSLRVEYYEKGGFAVAKLSWEKVSVPPAGPWHAEYFDNSSLSGPPALTCSASEIDFDWGWGSPDWRVPSDYFSARWTRTVHFDASGTYTFSARSDDGVRMWVDGSLVVDGWYEHPAMVFSGDKWLEAGDHNLRVEYYEHAGLAEIALWWDYAPPPPPAEVVVDEQYRGFAWGGTLRGRYNAWLGYRGHMYFTYNNRYYWTNYAKWVPSLPQAGYYEVYAYIPSAYASTRRARYRILHNGTRDDRLLNQGAYSNRWASLGTYYFNGWNVGREFIVLYDNTGEYPYSHYIGIDAIKFVAR